MLFRWCIWLGNICWIVFLILLIFASLKMQFLITFSTLHNLQVWVTTNFFSWKPKLASTSCLMNKIPAYPFPIYVYIYIPLQSLVLSSLVSQYLVLYSLFLLSCSALIIVVVLHHNFQVTILHYLSLNLWYWLGLFAC